MYTGLLTEGIVYLGCYKDHRESNRVLQTQQEDEDETNTPEDCARRCSQYRYAGVESGEECFCDDRMNNPEKISDQECNYKCPGDHSKMCGGHWKISVYTNWVCGPPPEIANGNATVRKDAKITYGSVADVICKPGFISTPTITCLSNTSWEKAYCEQPSTTTASTTPTSSHDASSESLTTVIPNTATPPVNSPAASTASSRTTVPSPSSFTSATPGNSSTSDKPDSALKDSSQGATPAATAAGVSVAVALAIAAIVIVLVLRKRGTLCFAITKRSTLENTDDNHHISLARKESKQNDDNQSQGAPLSNRTDCGLQKKGAMNTDKYYAVVGNNCASTESTPNGSYPGNMYQEIDTNVTYAGIDDTRQDNNDYDYTNTSFRDSNTDISDNVYNHLNSAGDEYDYVGKGQSNAKAMENNYDITSSAV
ncbi:hypothetical protein DPMN_036292 [Dreissena polymorpha]|uniref:WSC domain-containing protein n=1 Tax=Dreissena polymorpha TaxID=45954 RepID=A0A9D4MB96_DREPO|nr:hypothetical protein DPMN_036292 [Dreissena polymorpha]